MARGIVPVVVAVTTALLTFSCGENNNTTTPSDSGSKGCRNYATSSTTLTTISPSGTNTRTLNCTFNSTNQLNCTTTISACGTVTFAVTYASRADFVDEVSVIPPRMLQTAQTTQTNACGITDATYTYDGQKRLQRYSINGLTYNYTAWDASGRPTTGTVTGPSAPVNESWTYNDTARSATLVQSVAAGSTTTNYFYDVNGNPASVVVTAGGATSTSTTSTTATAQVCK